MNLKRLKDLREDNDFTQEELAQKIGCNKNTYSSWENGYALIPISYLDQLSSLYKVSFAYLLGLTKVKNPMIGSMDINRLREHMKNERKKRNLTQKDIAKVLKIGKTTYHDYEVGKYDIKLDKLVMLANYYKVDIDVFWEK